MRCPFCDADKESLKVIDSRACEGGRAIRRRRECLQCTKRFTTYERVEEQVKLTVIKKDGSRVPWDRAKVMSGLERACYKRPVEASELIRIVEEVEDEIFRSHEKEVPSSEIGRLVSDKLRRVDQVAYVRFSSVYRQFKTLDDLVQEAKAVLDAQRYDVPGQGRLFVEAGTTTGSGSAATAPASSTESPPINGGPSQVEGAKRAGPPGRGRRPLPASAAPPSNLPPGASPNPAPTAKAQHRPRPVEAGIAEKAAQGRH